ncbi:MAG: efflux RND transporter periplasmic adaptor subunit [Rhodospirillales bacterium]|nr:efflux RND transporter periplasmic adaptor subunit [Rhodospirillales bacterium]
MSRRAIFFALAAIAIAAGAGGYGLFLRLQPVVSTAAIVRGPAVQAIYATGTVEPLTWAKVAPVSTGRIVAIFRRDAEKVKEGGPLARLDEREARARLAELEAREKYWRDEVQRQAILAERGFASRETRDRSQSEHLQAQAAIAAQRQRILDLTLVAPMDGTVLRQDGEVGEVVDPKQVLFWIGQLTPLRITAEVDEEDIPRVREGQRTLVKADAFPGEELEGTVAEITPKGDPINKSYRVRIALPPDTPLRIGMTTEVNIVVRAVKDALLAPTGAVRDGRAFVVDGEMARARAVRTGIAGRGAVQILDGLAAGERVIIDPPAGLADGQRVRANEAAPRE